MPLFHWDVTSITLGCIPFPQKTFKKVFFQLLTNGCNSNMTWVRVFPRSNLDQAFPNQILSPSVISSLFPSSHSNEFSKPILSTHQLKGGKYSSFLLKRGWDYKSQQWEWYIRCSLLCQRRQFPLESSPCGR